MKSHPGDQTFAIFVGVIVLIIATVLVSTFG
jgi:hypothetical protein